MRTFARTVSLILFVVAVVAATALGWFTPLDQQLRSWRFQTTSRAVSGDMVFVEIDAASLKSLGLWPWPRTVHAALLQRLVDLGALDVVFDIDFSAASTPKADAAFAAALERAGGYAYLAAFQQSLSSGAVVLNQPLPAFAAQAASVLVNVDGDGTGLLQSVPAGLLSIPSIAHALVPGARAAAPSILIDYSIDLAQVTRVPVRDVLDGTVDPALLRDKQVIVGASAIELHDFFRVPRFGVIDGAMVQIAATETLKAGRNLTNWGFLPAALLGLLVVCAVVPRRLRLSVPQRAAAVLVVSLGLELGAWLTQWLGGQLLDTAVFHVMALGALALCFVDERAQRLLQSRRQQARLTYLARHDEISGALTRHALVEAFAQTAQNDALVVVKLMRLDAVNASLGHEVFDQVAREIIARLTRFTNVLPARLDSDVFAFAAQNAASADGMQSVVEAAAILLEQPYQIDGHTIMLGTIFGSAVNAPAGQDVAQMLQDAEVALALAQSGEQRSVLYQPIHGEQIRNRRLLDLALRQALERDEFHLLYQPQVDLRTGETIGLEALIRWRHPQLGIVSPADFIPLAEETGLIVEIGNWILMEACRQAAQWDWPGRLSVNVSAVQFAQGDLVASVCRALLASGLPPQRLDIEITESMYIADNTENVVILEQLSAMGVSLAMDDFGTGYSSLSYLTRLPISKIKIDQCFVRNLPNVQSEVIIETTVMMARRLGKIVIAEGVETDQQRAYLAAVGCDIGQGYLFGRPGPSRELTLQHPSAA